MANDDLEPADESTEQALKLPSLGFGRKKRKQAEAEPAEAPQAEQPPAEQPAPETDEAPTRVVEETRTDVTRPEPAEETVQVSAQEPAEEPAAEEGPTVAQPTAAEPTHVETEPAPAEAEPARAEAEREPVAAGGGGHRWADLTSAYDPTAVGTTPTQDEPEPEEGAEPRRRFALSLPAVGLEGVSGQLVALVVGAAAGVLMVLGTMLAMAGCDLVRGTSTCGGGPGFVLFVLLGAAVIVAATAALRVAGVAYAGTISFIAVALVVVVVAFLLLGVIFTAWMLGVIPVLSAASFVLAHALSQSFGEYSGPEWR